MYGDVDLVATTETKSNLFVTAVLRKLFTKTELADSIVITEKSTSTRRALDNERINLLKEAYYARYNVSENQKETVFLKIKAIINRKCYDIGEEMRKKAGNK